MLDSRKIKLVLARVVEDGDRQTPYIKKAGKEPFVIEWRVKPGTFAAAAWENSFDWSPVKRYKTSE